MTDAETAILAELRAVHERIASLTAELRVRRGRGRKRAQTRTAVIAASPVPMEHQPTELDMARARKFLRESK